MKLGDNILRKAKAITWPSVGVLHLRTLAAGRVNRRARYSYRAASSNGTLFTTGQARADRLWKAVSSAPVDILRTTP